MEEMRVVWLLRFANPLVSSQSLLLICESVQILSDHLKLITTL
jgi:hypothetical protein